MLEEIADRKKTLATTVRIDIRSLASFYKFCLAKEVHPNSYAEMLTIICETYIRLIRNANPEMDITSTQEAVDLFKISGLGNPTARKKQRGNLYNALAEEQQACFGDITADSESGVVMTGDEKQRLLELANKRNKEQKDLKGELLKGGKN